ncbi:MAG: HAD family hydrolase [Candidatus Obscuribacterales bacterium]
MSNKGICLDLDNTLYDYNVAHRPALEASLSWLSKLLNRERQAVQTAYSQARKRVNHDLHGLASSHSRLLYFQGVCEYFGVSPYETAIAAEDFYWQKFFENMQLRPGVLEFFQSMSMKSRPIVIVTDLTTRIQFQKITHLQLAPVLQAIVTSEEAGHEKPHPRIFELAAAKLQLQPEDICMIGDSWERDIEGALKFGMHCFWFREELQNLAKGPSHPEHVLELVTEFNDFYLLPQLMESK